MWAFVGQVWGAGFRVVRVVERGGEARLVQVENGRVGQRGCGDGFLSFVG